MIFDERRERGRGAGDVAIKRGAERVMWHVDNVAVWKWREQCGVRSWGVTMAGFAGAVFGHLVEGSDLDLWMVITSAAAIEVAMLPWLLLLSGPIAAAVTPPKAILTILIDVRPNRPTRLPARQHSCMPSWIRCGRRPTAAAPSADPRSPTAPPQDLGSYDTAVNNPDIAWLTPTLAKLSHEEGLRLERFYVNKFCSPTRRSYLTGRFPVSVSMMQVLTSLLRFLSQTSLVCLTCRSHVSDFCLLSCRSHVSDFGLLSGAAVRQHAAARGHDPEVNSQAKVCLFL